MVSMPVLVPLILLAMLVSTNFYGIVCSDLGCIDSSPLSPVDQSWLNSSWNTSAWNGVAPAATVDSNISDAVTMPGVPSSRDSSAGNSVQSWSSHQATWGESFLSFVLSSLLICI
jgi:hypothetical protein